MHADDVLNFLAALDEVAAHYWLDGGWGVDALLGEQTRTHSDLDLVVHRGDIAPVTTLLHGRAYEVIRDWLPTSIAFRDDEGREVDLHPVDPTPDRGGDQTLPGEQGIWHYGPPVEGTIRGRAVRCASAEDQMLMHTGYQPRAVDLADRCRLRQQFGTSLQHPVASECVDENEGPRLTQSHLG